MKGSPKRRAALVSIASNATLILGKAVAGLLTGSVAILSDAVSVRVPDVLAGVAIVVFALTRLIALVGHALIAPHRHRLPGPAPRR